MSKHTHTRIQLLRDSFPERPEMGPSLSRLLLEQVAAGERPATVRLSRPGRVVAFGRRDTVSPGYSEAAKAARAGGFEAMERLSGGRAAVYTEGTISLTMTTPERDSAARTTRRFELLARLIKSAFCDLGLDARVGEIPGEYCPGDYSVNAGGRIKLAGIAQRMIQGAAHVGAVLVVSDADLIRDVLVPVYSALELEWNPDSVGAAEDEDPALSPDLVDDALLEQLAEQFEVEAIGLDQPTARKTASRAGDFRSPG